MSPPYYLFLTNPCLGPHRFRRFSTHHGALAGLAIFLHRIPCFLVVWIGEPLGDIDQQSVTAHVAVIGQDAFVFLLRAENSWGVEIISAVELPYWSWWNGLLHFETKLASTVAKQNNSWYRKGFFEVLWRFSMAGHHFTCPDSSESVLQTHGFEVLQRPSVCLRVCIYHQTLVN